MRVREKWMQSRDKGTLESTYKGLGLPDDFPAAGLTRNAVRDIRARWMAEPGKREGELLSASTVNHRLSMLAVILEVLDLQPHGVKHLSTKGNRRRRRLSAEEVMKAREWAAAQHHAGRRGTDEFRRLQVVGLETGGRLSELLGIQGRHILGNVLTFPETKSGIARKVPLSPAAVAELGNLRGPMDKAFPTLNKDRVTALWAAMRQDLGLEHDHEFVFHLLRHEFASWLADKGEGAHIIQALLGHADIKTSENYVKVSLTGSARALGVDLKEHAA